MRKDRDVVAKMAILFIVFFFLFPFTSTAGDNSPQSDRLKTIRSLKKLDDFPLYKMHYYGDYDLPHYDAKISLPENLRNEISSGNTSQWACTCFSAKTGQGNQLLGRNFDWGSHPALLLFTDTPGRYASVSIVDIFYLGYSKSETPDKNPGGLLRSPHLPFDGMNEEGLAVGMMAVPSADGPADPQKQTVSSLMIIRLMLDHAKNVDEAIAVFENFNIDFHEGGYFRPVIQEVVEKYLDCGNPMCGFARIRCPDCGEERQLMFSCKTRGFCPSCHAKRREEWGEWMREELLLEVPHRQVVFTVPKMLRLFFRYKRKLLDNR